MVSLEDVRQAPGVYLMLDLDGCPVYAGQATNMKKRLKDHLISQKSDVVTDVLLDVYEVQCVAIWYTQKSFALPLKTDDDDDPDMRAKRLPLDTLEAALLRTFKPRWNRGKKPSTGKLPVLSLERPDQQIKLIEGKELALRGQPLQRIETKLLHILRAVRKLRISGGSQAVRRGLTLHAIELVKLCQSGVPSTRTQPPGFFRELDSDDP